MIVVFALTTTKGGANGSSYISITGTNIFSSNRDYGLEIDFKGEVTLENITADGNQTQDGVNIYNNPAGARDVTLTGTLSFTNNGNGDGDDGLYIGSRGNVTLADVIATGNRDEGVEINNTSSSASANVTISGTNDFSNNSRGGLIIRSDGNIRLNNVTADNGGGDGVNIENHTSNTRGFRSPSLARTVLVATLLMVFTSDLMGTSFWKM